MHVGSFCFHCSRWLLWNCCFPKPFRLWINAGYSYYFAGVSEDKAGWHEDGTSEGQFSLILRGDDLILFRDATGSLVSAQADGAKIYPLHIGDTSASVLVIYPLNAAEIYQFDLASKVTR